MEIFGIGPMELILILIVALMVFGPDKLPQIGAKLGRAMREMRKATRAISEEINTTRAAIEAPAKELAEPFKEVADAAKSVGSVAAAARNPGQALRDSVLRELKTPEEPENPANETATEENTIARPQTSEIGAAAAVPSIAVASDPTLALPQPEEPLLLSAPEEVTTLPAPEPVAALPEPEEHAALPVPEDQAALPEPEQPSAPPPPEESPEKSEDSHPRAEADSPPPTTPEQ